MTPPLARTPRHRAFTAAAIGLGLALVLAPVAGQVVAPVAPASPTLPARPAAALATPVAVPARSEEGIRWAKLKPTQRDALKPLQQEWSGIDAPRKQKWLELADRMPSMPADERARVQTRMAEWARLTPAERGQARLRFQEAKQIPASDRVTRWEAYQALPPEQKNALAARAASGRPGSSGTGNGETSARRPQDGTRSEPGERREASQVKSNIVTIPSYAMPPRPVAPTVVRAGPGATTTLITRRPSPPPHQQVGLPKIAATPEFVNKSTLLPQRGAQGAAMRAISAAPGATPAGTHPAPPVTTPTMPATPVPAATRP